MRVERTPTLLAALLLLTAGAVIPSRISSGWSADTSPRVAEAQQVTEAPHRVRLTRMERDAVRHEMQTMLRSLNLILHGLADGRAEMVEKAARASGKSLALDPRLEEKLPPQYAGLDQRTHLRFDRLADLSKGGAIRGNVVQGLAAITGYCVACHDIFRVDKAQ